MIFLFWMSLNEMMTSSAGEKGSWLHIAFRQSIAQSMSEAEQVLSNGLYPFNAIKKTEFRVVNSFQVISRKLQYFNDWPEIIFHILFERDKMIKMILTEFHIESFIIGKNKEKDVGGWRGTFQLTSLNPQNFNI